MVGLSGHSVMLLSSSFCQQNSVAPCTAPPLPAWNGAVQGAQLPLPGGRPVASRSPQGGRPPGSVTITRLKAPPVVLPSAVQAPVREWFPVWVGNLTPKVTQDALLRYFLPFGPIESIRCLPQKFCAFINYTRREAAEAAYAALQGVEVEGKSLQLQLKPPMRALPPATKAPGGPPQPLKREQAPLTPALALPRPNASRAKGDGSSLGAHPQRGATPAKKRQQP
ncbi:PREDICTED: pre-mRNA-splicing factor RBM22-like [Gekko japonicus]|uniref:Pre-mRNA-splicing factor RBM22-like n=1 Tax=Gekko japonicus TaxID=146911 RepID=A0ABM1JSG2_GEKJA|nr:PREDICTED: pre-mRNA-splicing factor RBM22-like [Gekko japonicus]